MSDDNGRRTMGQIEATVSHLECSVDTLWRKHSEMRRDIERLGRWRAWLTGAMIGIAAVAGRNVLSDLVGTNHVRSSSQVAHP